MPNKKLSFTHQITESRNFGKETVNQKMIVTVRYTEDEDFPGAGLGSIEVLSVDIYQNGAFVAEIGKLLDEAEGNPLNTILEAINWQEIYSETIQPA